MAHSMNRLRIMFVDPMDLIVSGHTNDEFDLTGAHAVYQDKCKYCQFIRAAEAAGDRWTLEPEPTLDLIT